MSASVSIKPAGPVNGSIQPPGSKSITNRAIICAALGYGESLLKGVLESDDTIVMLEAWRKLGLELTHDRINKTLRIQGCSGRLPESSQDQLVELFIGNSGTTVRFLTAALSVCRSGRFLLDGVARMRERPIADLLRTLNALGACVRSVNSSHADCPPVSVEATGWTGGAATVAGNISSQFLSGLMLAAPLADEPVELAVEGDLVSLPYVEMTRAVMHSFGARVEGPAAGPMKISNDARYQGCVYDIEPDASAASYFWAAAAIAGGQAKVCGLTRQSLQGDVKFCDVLQKMGCEVEYQSDGIVVRGPQQPGAALSGTPLRGVDVDMGEISDTVQTLAAVALFAEGPTTVRGVAHNRVKETDRITDLATELRRLGAEVEEFEDGLRITPPAKVLPARVQTYDDHRMAMSLALVGLRAEGVVIENPGCTAKTYPDYWQDLKSFTGCGVD